MDLTQQQKTASFHNKDANRQWWVLDAQEFSLGRLATQVAHLLRGKHKVTFSPQSDQGDFVIVINAQKVQMTGKKRSDKIYHHHTGYIGNLKSESFEDLIARQPARVIEKAVKGMLPKNPLGRQMYRKLKVYADNNHPHQAQNPHNYPKA